MSYITLNELNNILTTNGDTINVIQDINGRVSYLKTTVSSFLGNVPTGNYVQLVVNPEYDNKFCIHFTNNQGHYWYYFSFDNSTSVWTVHRYSIITTAFLDISWHISSAGILYYTKCTAQHELQNNLGSKILDGTAYTNGTLRAYNVDMNVSTPTASEYTSMNGDTDTTGYTTATAVDKSGSLFEFRIVYNSSLSKYVLSITKTPLTSSGWSRTNTVEIMNSQIYLNDSIVYRSLDTTSTLREFYHSIINPYSYFSTEYRVIFYFVSNYTSSGTTNSIPKILLCSPANDGTHLPGYFVDFEWKYRTAAGGHYLDTSWYHWLHHGYANSDEKLTWIYYKYAYSNYTDISTQLSTTDINVAYNIKNSIVYGSSSLNYLCMPNNDLLDVYIGESGEPIKFKNSSGRNNVYSKAYISNIDLVITNDATSITSLLYKNSNQNITSETIGRSLSNLVINPNNSSSNRGLFIFILDPSGSISNTGGALYYHE